MKFQYINNVQVVLLVSLLIIGAPLLVYIFYARGGWYNVTGAENLIMLIIFAIACSHYLFLAFGEDHPHWPQYQMFDILTFIIKAQITMLIACFIIWLFIREEATKEVFFASVFIILSLVVLVVIRLFWWIGLYSTLKKSVSAEELPEKLEEPDDDPVISREHIIPTAGFGELGHKIFVVKTHRSGKKTYEQNESD